MKLIRTGVKLDEEYYLQEDVVSIARDLLGKTLYSCVNGRLSGGLITETEAYAGINDKASHAYGNRRTTRTEIMFKKGGLAYVYLCYGVHSLFNVVTNGEGVAHAVLIRGIYPVEGVNIMKVRAGNPQSLKKLGAGPGKVSKILDIHYSMTGTSLLGNTIWIEKSNLLISNDMIHIATRIGVDYAAEDALLPYRFFLKDSERILGLETGI